MYFQERLFDKPSMNLNEESNVISVCLKSLIFHLSKIASYCLTHWLPRSIYVVYIYSVKYYDKKFILSQSEGRSSCSYVRISNGNLFLLILEPHVYSVKHAFVRMWPRLCTACRTTPISFNGSTVSFYLSVYYLPNPKNKKRAILFYTTLYTTTI